MMGSVPDNDDNSDDRVLAVRQNLGDRIRELRTKQEIGQDAFAFKAGIHRTHIGSIERAEVDPRLSTVQKIAEALGITLAELLKD